MIYLSLEQVLILHELQIGDYGGSHGIRDIGLLESALFRPQTTFGGKDLYPTVFIKAAVLAYSLLKNHPFVDGNKRTATVSMIVFLELNNYKLRINEHGLAQLMLKFEAGKIDLNDFILEIESHSHKLS